MKLYDITVPISPSLPTFPGDPPVKIEPVTRIEKGDAANVSRITMSSHCGSHIDVSLHYNEEGISLENLPLTLLIGNALVADLRGITEIGRDVLARLPLTGVERLLLKTDNSLLWERTGFYDIYAHLTRDGAEYLLTTSVQLIGIDYLSIEGYSGDGQVHRLLLRNGVVVLEGLNLEGIEQGEYELICLPLKITGGDGAPVRAVLRSKEPLRHPSGFDPHTSKWPLA